MFVSLARCWSYYSIIMCRCELFEYNYWIPGMEGIHLKDVLSLTLTSSPDDNMMEYCLGEINNAHRASAIVFNTFENLEHRVLDPLSSIFPRNFPVGPLHFYSRMRSTTTNWAWLDQICGKKSQNASNGSTLRMRLCCLCEFREHHCHDNQPNGGVCLGTCQ